MPAVQRLVGRDRRRIGREIGPPMRIEEQLLLLRGLIGLEQEAGGVGRPRIDRRTGVAGGRVDWRLGVLIQHLEEPQAPAAQRPGEAEDGVQPQIGQLRQGRAATFPRGGFGPPKATVGRPAGPDGQPG